MPEKRPDPDQRWTIGKWGRHHLVIGPDTGPAESSKEVVDVISLSAVSELLRALRWYADESDAQRRRDGGRVAREALSRFPVPDEKEKSDA